MGSPRGAAFGVIDLTIFGTTDAVDKTAYQTVPSDLGTKDGVKSIRIGFTDQRLTAHDGLAEWM